jgi:outer membrane protein assembly factor BamA
VHYAGSFRPQNSKLVAQLDLKASGIEILRFYGKGNNSDDGGGASFYRVRSRQFRAAPGVRVEMMDERLRVGAGPWLEYAKTKDGNRKIDQLSPYGAGNFGLIGGFANVQFDTRRAPADTETSLSLPFHENPAAGYPTSGFLFDVTSEVSPPVWDVDRTWGAIEGSVSGFYSVGEGDWATFAVRVGGRDTWGTTPYFKLAYIGGGAFFSGGSSVRGLRTERFAGDSSVFGNLDLRVVVGRVKLVVPGDFGVLGFGDVGRVFEDGESSKKWHPGFGGGVWFAPLARTNAISFTVARSEEDTLVYLRFGFAF